MYPHTRACAASVRLMLMPPLFSHGLQGEQTPLILASFGGHCGAVDQLIAAKAIVNALEEVMPHSAPLPSRPER